MTVSPAPPEGTAPAADWGPDRLRLPGLGPATRSLVTGGAGAIGRRCAERLLGLGASVAIMSRSAESVEATVGSLGRAGTAGRVLGEAGDVGSEADVRRVVARLEQEWGGLDLVVHCGAVGDDSPLADLDQARINALLSTNVAGTLLVAKAAAGIMGPGSSIVNVASVMAHRVWPERSLYATSKAAVVHATRALAAELGPRGIRVNSVSPGNTPTVLTALDDRPGQGQPASPGGSAARIPLRRRGELDDYVGPVLFLASDLAAYTTGVDIVVDGGLIALRP
ncbi:MAG TPA: SDR family oxidoreductase [Acidimicrobiales bacterium]|nr:SDR family oxidoreductase [Acidimicrobiales bacterium]